MHTRNEIERNKPLFNRERLITIPTFFLVMYMCYMLTFVPTNHEAGANNQNTDSTVHSAQMSTTEAVTQQSEIQVANREIVETQLILARVVLELRGKNSISVGSGTLVSINGKLFVLTAHHVSRNLAQNSPKFMISDTISQQHINDGSIRITTQNGVIISTENILMVCETQSTGISTTNSSNNYTDENGHSIDGACAIPVGNNFQGYTPALADYAYPIDTEDINISDQGNIAMFANPDGIIHSFIISSNSTEKTIIPIEFHLGIEDNPIEDNPIGDTISMICPGNSGSVVVTEKGRLIGVVIIGNSLDINMNVLYAKRGCWPSGFAYNTNPLLAFLTQTNAN